MKKRILLPVFFATCLCCKAQTEEAGNSMLEQQLENRTMQNENFETEDDQYVQDIDYLLRHPLDINAADATDLEALKLLSAIQVQQFLLYRSLVGRFIDVYELQAVPGWDLHTIAMVRNCVRVGMGDSFKRTAWDRLRKGEHRFLLRASQVLEKSKGFLQDSSTAVNYYPGSPQKFFLRYKYSYKNLLQYGLIAEKDPGEQFFKGKQKAGFDFYSFHVFMRKAGIVRALAIGDFTVNMGQGLVQWQSLAFGKSAAVLNIKRESPVLRPYSSAGEINFYRGAGITLGKRNWESTVFVSYRKLDANFIADSSAAGEGYISSLQASGYHRTYSETIDKGIQRQLAVGGNFTYRYERLQLGINAVYTNFKYPFTHSLEPYNKYAILGNRFGNYSITYSYGYRNIHFFGEAAFGFSSAKAFVSGLIASLSSSVDIALLYRNISPAFQAIHASAFTEGAAPENEKGFYAGISLRPGPGFSVDAYTDVYRLPWLRYQVNAPSSGCDYLLQFGYRPDKKVAFYMRYHREAKAVKGGAESVAMPYVISQVRKNWRIHVTYQAASEIELRSRVEMNWETRETSHRGQGFLFFTDLLYKPRLKPYSTSLRFQYFETDGYDSRVYTYETDVLYSYSVPAFYDKGLRYYINISYDLRKNLSLWARFSQTVFSGKTLIGSGLDAINGSHKTEVKLQVLYIF